MRAFVLGRMSYDPTAPPGSMVTANSMDMMGALTGTSVTGFSTFSTQRGPTTILDQMWIRFDVLERVFVTVGKQHVRWGTGRFWQPTDYLHPVKRNPLDVFDARPGASMLKLHVPWEERGWNFYGFGIFEDPNNASSQLNQVAGGARAEIVVGGAEIGIDGLFKRGQNPRLGIDISTGIWDFDVYADVAVRWAEDFNVVRKVDPPAGVMCVNPDGTTTVVNDLSQQYQVVPLGTGARTQAVGGINWSRKYNDNDLFTIGVEYFYNQPGYSDPSLYPGLLFNNLRTPMLNFFYTGKHYAALFASLPAPYSWNYTTFTLSTLANLSDASAVTRLDYSFTMLTHLTLQAFVGVHYGTREGEFRLGFDIPAQTVMRPDGTCEMVPPIRQAPAILDLGVALRVKILSESLLRHEAVARPAHGEEVHRAVGVGLELGAQLRDEVVDGAGLADVRQGHAPHLAQQLVAREHAVAGLRQKKHQQLELQVGQLHRLAAAGHRARAARSITTSPNRSGRRRAAGWLDRAAGRAWARRSTAATRASSSASANGLVT